MFKVKAEGLKKGRSQMKVWKAKKTETGKKYLLRCAVCILYSALSGQ